MAKSNPKTDLKVENTMRASAEKTVRVRIRSLDIPPIKDGLVIGRDAAIGGDAMLRTLRLMTNEKFERVVMRDPVVEEAILRASVLRKLGRERVISLILERIKPLMGENELLMLDMEVELVIEHSLHAG